MVDVVKGQVTASAPLPWSARERQKDLNHLGERVYDLIIIGGGINGAAIARDATLRGYSVLLLEQGDFAQGTSSRSSRLIHGGLRYLEHFEIALVFESVSERHLLSQVARHLVRPLSFVYPVYAGEKPGLNKVDLGLWVYDSLALFRNYRFHQRWMRTKVRDRLPELKHENLRGAIQYYDYRTSDVRLVIENLLDARDNGATIISRARAAHVRYARSISDPHTVEVVDRLSPSSGTAVSTKGDTYLAHGRIIVTATGVWTDEVLGASWTRPTKGVHVVVPKEKRVQPLAPPTQTTLADPKMSLLPMRTFVIFSRLRTIIFQLQI